jgi:hypothetical protein
VESERIAARVLDGVLDPSVSPATASRLGLDLLDAVDPRVEVTASTSLPTPEGVAEMSVSQLLTLGERLGIDPSPNGSTEP